MSARRHPRGPRRGVTVLAAVTAGLLLTLAGCSASVDEQEARAAEIFDTLVAAAAESGVDQLRTVQTEEPEQRSCGDETDDVTTVRTATATPPVTATEVDLIGAVAELVGVLDPEVWVPIATTPGANQQAVQDEHDTVATITVQDRILVIAVFTPCRTP